MEVRPPTAALVAMHRLLVVIGIVLLPIAMVTRKLGVVPPIHRALEGLQRRVNP